jgi:DNA-binding transcriptional LysR family regulator
MIGISPRQLEVFVAIATAGSVRAAAEQLHLSQPAASMALGEFERQLGAPVFDRVQRRLRLNSHGRQLLPLAQEVLERLRELSRVATATPAQLAGELRLGASNTVGNYLVGDLLGGFVAAHSKVSVRLHVDNTDAILAGVLDYSLDLGCIEGAAAHADLLVLPWRMDALRVCAPMSHPLARRKRLRPEDFAGARWILREAGSATRSQTERVLALLPPGDTVLELDQSEAIKQAVIAGLGLALLPAVAVEHAQASGRLAALHTPFLPLDRPLSFVLHRRGYRDALLQAFLASVQMPSDRKP